ncbi:MAG: outer membrane beta-barrel protein [bacterium]
MLYCSSVSADTGFEFGLNANSSWSDNNYLKNPEGWGFSVSKNINNKISVRLSFNRYSRDFKYFGVMSFGYPPPEADTTTEIISSKARIHFYEITANYSIYNGNKFRVDIGGGFGKSNPKLTLTGEQTYSMMSNDDDQALIILSFDVTIKEFIYKNTALRMGYNHREATYGAKATDSFYPFDELSLSSVNINLIVQF